MKTGDTVKYSKPRCDEEKEFRFTLLELFDGVAKIQLHCDWAIKPVETVSESEVELV